MHYSSAEDLWPAGELIIQNQKTQNTPKHQGKRHTMKRKMGFTLVEIMIVVVIIGLLAVMAIPAFNRVRSASQENVVVSNLRTISHAAQQYFTQTGKTEVAWADLCNSTDGFITAEPKAVGDENYATTFAKISMGYTQLSIKVPGLKNKDVTYTE
jgi:type IV pilus assembly protein PilA